MFRQVKILSAKNFALYRRNWGTTVSLAGLGCIFILSLFWAQSVLDANKQQDLVSLSLNPAPYFPRYTIPPCSRADKSWCYAFIYSPMTTWTDSLVETVLKAAELAPESAKGFSDEQAMVDFLFANQNRTRLAFSFPSSDSEPFSYSILYNETRVCELFGFRCSDSIMEWVVPAAIAIDAALMDLFEEGSHRIFPTFQPFAQPDLEYRDDAMEAFGDMFFWATLIFLFILQLQFVVKEKETQLKEAMRVNGMTDFAYWASTFAVNTVMSLLILLLMCATGAALGMEFFLDNSFLLYFLLFLLTSEAMIAMMYAVQPFLQRVTTARSVGIAIFLLFDIAGSLLVELYFVDDESGDSTARSIIALFPPFLFFKGFRDLIVASAGASAPGLEWGDRSTHVRHWPLTSVYNWLLIDTLMLLCIGFYFDRVIPSEVGRVEQPWFLFSPGWWTGRPSGVRFEDIQVDIDPLTDPQVAKEEQAVKDGAFGNRDIAVVVRGLRKAFGDFVAVDNVSFAVDKKSCFCLLGHNGAGKSTSLHMLIGYLNLSAGSALINGHDVRSDLPGVRQSVGVCPQHNIFWPELTGREHLELFGGLKGVPSDRVDRDVSECLEAVQLSEQANELAGSYSGGMVRRLCLGLALIGKPEILILDEPTCGLDPLVKRKMWDTIQEIKAVARDISLFLTKFQKHTVILTTHSLLEADVLSDIVAVMAKGKLQTMGSAIHLKRKFGAGYRLNILLKSGSPSDDAEALVKSVISLAVLESRRFSDLVFRLPVVGDLELARLIEKLEGRKESAGIERFSLGLTTLEEAFLSLAKEDRMREMLEDPKIGLACLGCGRTMDVAEKMTSDPLEIGTALPAVICSVCHTKQTLPALMFPWKRQCPQCQTPTVTPAGHRTRTCATCGTTVHGGGDHPLGASLTEPEVGEAVRGAAAAPRPREELKFSFWSQLNALVRKTVVFQRRQRGQMACIALFPLLVLALVVLINVLISSFDTSDQYNYGCLNNNSAFEYKRSVSPELSPDVGAVGGLFNEIDREFEFPDYSFVPYITRGSGVEFGERSSGSSPLVFQWMLTVQTLVEGLAVCEDDFNDDVNDDSDVFSAHLWRENLLEREQFSVVLGQCKKSFLRGDKPEELSLDGEYRPSNASLTKLDLLEETRALCSESAGASLIAVLQAPPPLPVAASESNSGFLASFTTETIGFPRLELFQDELERRLVTCDLPSLQEVCLSTRLMANASQCGVLGLEGACFISNNRDLVRNLTVSPLPGDSVDSLQQLLFDSWFNGRMDGGLYHSPVVAYDLSSLQIDGSEFNYTVLYNRTASPLHPFAMTLAELAGTHNWPMLTMLMNNAILKHRINRTVDMRVRPFPTIFREELFQPFGGYSVPDIVGYFLFPFVLWILFPLFLSVLMQEKERKLLVISQMMGLRSSVYYFVMYALFLVEFMASTAIFWIVGALLGIKLFTIHNPLILASFFFLWGNILVAQALLMATFFRRSGAALFAGFLLLFLSVISGLIIINMLFNNEASESDYLQYTWFPPFNFLRLLLFYVSASVAEDRVTWDVLDQTPVVRTFWLFAVQWVVLMVLMLYFGQVLPSEDGGVRKHPLFFLSWMRSAKAPREETKRSSLEDVRREEDRVMAEQCSSVLQIKQMVKRFGPASPAVDNISFGVDRGECLGLLGANGAGKSTLVNCVSGLLQPTSGGAIVDGDSHDLLSKIQLKTGVCPQDDLLWECLTVREHLLFYGRLKQLKGHQLETAVQFALDAVKLKAASGKCVSQLSGGMKRRLSVANALISHPLLLLLDEPSSGLDPASRMNLEEVITKSKTDTGVLLTTHSLEEADALCDRIAVLHHGTVRCIGPPSELKHRYGSGYTLLLRSAAPLEAIRGFVGSVCPGGRLLNYHASGSSTWELPRARVDLKTMFRRVSEARSALGIVDWGISETALEEVFTKATSAEAAAFSGESKSV